MPPAVATNRRKATVNIQKKNSPLRILPLIQLFFISIGIKISWYYFQITSFLRKRTAIEIKQWFFFNNSYYFNLQSYCLLYGLQIRSQLCIFIADTQCPKNVPIWNYQKKCELFNILFLPETIKRSASKKIFKFKKIFLKGF